MPTIRRCCIVGCMSNSRQHPQLQFFQFPRPENPFHKLWKQACHASLSRILPFKKPVVCALHFQPNCIGGRRLISSAVPSLLLEVPSNLKDVEQKAMFEEIERSRKCAYINAVVFEWLVRANLNPQLRGQITHGMIKERAENAKQLIGSTQFVADNRWLNRFRETHLSDFAKRLANGQLKPRGTSLFIRDIVQELHESFPPTRVSSVEEMPEQYINYMQEYGEYDDEDDSNDMKDTKDTSYQEQQQQALYQQQQYQNGAGGAGSGIPGVGLVGGYDANAAVAAGYTGTAGYGHFDQYSYERQQQQHHHHLQQQQQHYQQQFQQQQPHYPIHAQHAAHHHHQMVQQAQLPPNPYGGAYDIPAQQLPNVGYAAAAAVAAASHHHLAQSQHPFAHAHAQQHPAHAFSPHQLHQQQAIQQPVHPQAMQQPHPQLQMLQQQRSVSNSPPNTAAPYGNRMSPQNSQRSSPVMGMFSKRARIDTPTASSTPIRIPSQTGTTPQPSTSAGAVVNRDNSCSQAPTQVKAPTPTILSVASMLQENGKRRRSNEDLAEDNFVGGDYSNVYDEQVRSPAVSSAAAASNAAPSSPGVSQHSAASNGNGKSNSHSNSNSNDGDGFVAPASASASPAPTGSPARQSTPAAAAVAGDSDDVVALDDDNTDNDNLTADTANSAVPVENNSEQQQPTSSKINGLTNGHHSASTSSNSSSGMPSPTTSQKSLNAKTNGHHHQNNHLQRNGNATPTSTSSTAGGTAISSSTIRTNSTMTKNESAKELDSYEQALEYLKPLEDFVLIKENFRAIGLVVQLEDVLKRSLERVNKKRSS